MLTKKIFYFSFTYYDKLMDTFIEYVISLSYNILGKEGICFKIKKVVSLTQRPVVIL